MSIDLRHSFVVCAAMLAGCDFTGLPEDRSRYTSGADGGSDPSLQDASTRGDATLDADASIGGDATVADDASSAVDASPSFDAGDACAAKSSGELAVERCGSRVCGTIDVTDNCGTARSITCGTCANGAACETDNRCPWSGGPPAPTCSAGTLPGGGACQACDLNTCGEPTCDDGTTAAANLGTGAFECQHRSSSSSWATAMSYCAGLGSGWRLPTKGEALRIASSPNVCRTPLPAAWATWTRTCAGAGLAWYVYIGGSTYQVSVDDVNHAGYGSFALCVR